MGGMEPGITGMGWESEVWDGNQGWDWESKGWD